MPRAHTTASRPRSRSTSAGGSSSKPRGNSSDGRRMVVSLSLLTAGARRASTVTCEIRGDASALVRMAEPAWCQSSTEEHARGEGQARGAVGAWADAPPATDCATDWPDPDSPVPVAPVRMMLVMMFARVSVVGGERVACCGLSSVGLSGIGGMREDLQSGFLRHVDHSPSVSALPNHTLPPSRASSTSPAARRWRQSRSRPRAWPRPRPRQGQG